MADMLEGGSARSARSASSEPERELEEDAPEYLKEVTDCKFLKISIKTYDKKTSSSGFSKEEYYAYHIVSM